MKHIELFKDGFDSTVQEKIQPENYPYVGHDTVSSEIVYTLVPETWVTFTAQEDNSSIGLSKLSTNQTLEYSTNTTTWNTFDTTTNISLNNGDNVYVRGILIADNTSSNYTQFTMDGKITASGNCNAIWNYEDLNTSLKVRCGYKMFYSCTSLTTAPELPATTLSDYCYYSMFHNCTSLTNAPVLHATTLADDCYNSMFNGCTSLVIAPELPATVLSEWCYSNMFQNCTALTTAPVLPATKLAERCYAYMFQNCISLTIAPELPATTMYIKCYYRMFDSCTSLTTAPKILPATKVNDTCYACMFENCTSLTTAPELPATALSGGAGWGCYQSMFTGCTSLNYIKCLAIYTTAKNCTSGWVDGVSSTGMFVKHPNKSDWSTGTSGIPEGWTVVDAEL